MNEAVITFVTLEVDDEGNSYPVTKVFRLNFESEQDFDTFMRSGDDIAVSVESLSAK